MRRITAKRAYTRIDESGFVRFADAFVPVVAPETYVFDGNYAQFRAAFIAITRELRLPSSGSASLTWGFLRPGGATWLIRKTDSPDLVRFRGRWTNHRMLEIYVQEVGAVSMLTALRVETRDRIQTLAAAAPALLARAASRYCNQ